MPNKGSFYIETYGCTSNKADSYIIINQLINSNYNQTDLEKANFLIINTCAVKEQTENKIKARLEHLNKYYGNSKYIIIAGCLPHITPDYTEVIKKIVPDFAAIIDLNNIHEISQIFDLIIRGEKNLIVFSENSIDKAKFHIFHQPGKITGIIPISEGCLGSCTYCCVKNARGKLNCYDPKSIVENIKYQLDHGIKQIYLTSQDCSIYQYNEMTLSDLVGEIAKLDKNFFLRIGMINPSFLIDKIEQLNLIFNYKKVYQFLHIPIQSGSNEVLKRMQRKYLISAIIYNIDLLRKKFNNLTISTDIICGFPGETEYDFYRTINLIKWLKPEILNISKFTPRPGTIAKKMVQLSSKIIKERSIRLSRVFRNSLTDMNKNWIGWEGEALILHEGTEPNQAFGRNFAYKNIFLDNYKGEYGEFANIKIYKIDGFNLYGKII
ncbi:MAG: tRNA (N(6)-L-threonylcarbamoyladenosine(37)-C(2))-methylthiotransferase [Candidatus Lokiarchaeota archaeon]|nr:tRNA (N(6)-L-threonylcarbamoyladenosine(37)-C(2))-methylthiotransferase [Candidatus Lokiarchaeota archaeon]